MKFSGLFAILTLAVIALAEQPSNPSPNDLIVAATTRFGPGENYPVLPSLSTEMRAQIGTEINRPNVKRAFELLDAKGNQSIDWLKAVEILETEKAIWSLQACLVHPSEDVQVSALGALGRLKDKNTVPFLLIYCDYMAVVESGNENATVHGVIHESIASTLASITGIEVKINNQDPAELRRGLFLWTKWLVEQHPCPLTKSSHGFGG